MQPASTAHPESSTVQVIRSRRLAVWTFAAVVLVSMAIYVGSAPVSISLSVAALGAAAEVLGSVAIPLVCGIAGWLHAKLTRRELSATHWGTVLWFMVGFGALSALTRVPDLF